MSITIKKKLSKKNSYAKNLILEKQIYLFILIFRYKYIYILKYI